MKVILNIEYSSGEKEQIIFDKYNTFVVGRAKTSTNSQLRGDKYISRHHFILEINPPYCSLKDLGSTNGTKVNGVKLAKGETRELSRGDEIYAGRTTLRIDIQKKTEKEEPESNLLKKPEVHCVECDKDVTHIFSDKSPDELEAIIYTCENCIGRSAKGHFIKINRDWFDITKDLLERLPNKINIPGLELIIEKKFKREELVNRLSDLNFTEKQIDMIFEQAVEDKTEAITCQSCNKIMTEMADKDGKAEELREMAIYFCPACKPERDGNFECNKLGNYELIKLLGSGGMGEVYKAWHILTGRIVALKKILPHVAMDEKGYKLFQREINIMARLKHPGIVRFYEYGRTGNTLYCVTEFLNRGDPGEIIKRTLAPLPYKTACNIICQALDGLEFAHSQNYIHRDIKPENILLNKDKSGLKAKLSDFGLAKNFQEAGGSMLTQEKEFMGTLLFMPPEQLRNYRYVKPPADIYSMGVSLYYLLTGKYIFPYPSPLDIFLARQKEEKINLNKYEDPLLMVLSKSPLPVETHKIDIPESLAKIVNKSIMKKEKDRYSSAKKFKEDIIKAIEP